MKKLRVLSAGIAALTAAAMLPFTAAAYEKGDVNHDGFIDARDASDVLQEYAVLSTGGAASLSLTDGDYNGDGKINAADASDILIKYAELSTGGGRSVCLSDGYTSTGAMKGKGATPSAEFVTAQTDLAVKLMQNTASEKNVMISPYSVTEALVMTANGANGDTLKEMESVLGLDMEKMNSYLYKFREKVTGAEEFGSANSIWFRDDRQFVPKPDFMQLNAEMYGADIYKAPFDRSTVNDINSWVNDKTDGLIPMLLERIGDDMMMYLINAAVFEGEWAHKYEDFQVHEGKFTAADGTEQDAEMMYCEEYDYLESDNAVGFLKYYRGYKFAFAVILPDEGITLDEYIAELDGNSLSRMLKNKESSHVITAMPKFSYEYSVDLGDALKAMGMVTPFSEMADFSGISDFPLLIDNVTHKTYIDVNEFGTKAGAVTSVGMAAGAAPVEFKYVTLDRPFLYCIVDAETYVPLFMGTVKSLEK